MDEHDRFDRVVASLFDAQLDDANWPTASALFDDACGLLGNHLAVIRGDHPGNSEFLFGKLFKRGESDEELEDLYIRNYFPADERLPRYFNMAEGELRHITNMFTDRERKISPTYNEFLVPTGAANSLNVHMLGQSDLHIVMLLVRSGVISNWSSEQIQMIQRLLPHVRQFVRVRQALAEAQTGAIHTAANALAAKRIGIALIDGSCRIVEVNEHARKLLKTSDGLSDHAGYLLAHQAHDNASLQEILSKATEREIANKNGGSILIRRIDGSPLVIHVSPLHRSEISNFGDVCGLSCMVLIVDPFDNLKIDADAVARALGLSQTQGRVVAALASGVKVRDIAKTFYRTEATIRWHIKQMLSRFGYSSQADLIRLVLTTPGVFDLSD